MFDRLQEETAKVEGHLINGNFTDEIISCFNTAKANAFDPNVLEPLLKLLRLSPYLASMLAKPEMFLGIAQKLGHKKAVVRLNLLRLVRNILDARETDYFNSPKHRYLRSLLDAIQVLADKDSAVLVRNLASELVRSHINGEPDSTGSMLSATSAAPTPIASSSRSRSVGQRVYTPPSLSSGASGPIPAPSTPTHGRRPSQISFIEVASSPKRSAVSIAHERDSSMYRPHSREGGGVHMSPLPRRVSGDNMRSASRTRLSRNPGGFSRPPLIPSASEPIDIRAHAAAYSSNKENQGSAGTRYPLVSGSPTTTSSSSGHSRPGSGRQRRESSAKRWTSGA